MPQLTILDIPAATVAAFAIVAALRWAYGDGPGSGRCRPWPLAGLVVGLAGFALWRILALQDGGLNVFDAIAGILCGMLLVTALKAAWADGPFKRMPPKTENTPFLVLTITGLLVALFLTIGFNCFGLIACRDDAMPEWVTLTGGQHVDSLPADFQ